MSYLNDYLLEAQIEDAYEAGYIDALEKIAAGTDGGTPDAEEVQGFGKKMKEHGAKAWEHVKAHKGKYGAGAGTLGALAGGAYLYNRKRGQEKKAAYEAYILEKIAEETWGEKFTRYKDNVKGYGKSAYEHVGNHKGKYAAGAGLAALGGGLYAYKKRQEKKAALENLYSRY